MSYLADLIASDRFIVTSELNPPKGVRLDELFRKAEALKRHVDAFNLTDSHAAHMTMTPLAAAHLLARRGIEPILQITTRDRNRIALQSDLLGAFALGIENVVFMGGDPPSAGDHPDAKPVFDVYSSLMLRAATSMENGHDMAGNPLKSNPTFCLGAVCNPGADDLDDELRRMEEKIDAGARFFQTQAIFEPQKFERFVRASENLETTLLAGIIPLKSVKMARYMNTRVLGIYIPDALVQRMANADNRRAESIEIAASIIREVLDMCRGLHVMAIGWEEVVPEIIDAAGIKRER
ncbi:MAG: methylenetetrahydrofolate reductase [Gammaproteobacteria bacterium]|nr:methylenetetrahydrofolate reductase [Gammaproteobacteria bacterium]